LTMFSNPFPFIIFIPLPWNCLCNLLNNKWLFISVLSFIQTPAFRFLSLCLSGASPRLLCSVSIVCYETASNFLPRKSRDVGKALFTHRHNGARSYIYKMLVTGRKNMEWRYLRTEPWGE
jgi:hypothetical protein